MKLHRKGGERVSNGCGRRRKSLRRKVPGKSFMEKENIQIGNKRMSSKPLSN